MDFLHLVLFFRSLFLNQFFINTKIQNQTRMFNTTLIWITFQVVLLKSVLSRFSHQNAPCGNKHINTMFYRSVRMKNAKFVIYYIFLHCNLFTITCTPFRRMRFLLYFSMFNTVYLLIVLFLHRFNL